MYQYDIPIIDTYAKDYTTDRIQPIQYNIVYPINVTISPQKLEVAWKHPTG